MVFSRISTLWKVWEASGLGNHQHCLKRVNAFKPGVTGGCCCSHIFAEKEEWRQQLLRVIFFFVLSWYLLKGNKQPQMESLVLNPTKTYYQLIAVSASLRSRILNNSVWNFLVCTREVICSRPLHCHKARFPSPQAMDGFWPMACQEPGCIAGGEQWAGQLSFIRIYSCSSSLAFLPELCLLSHQHWHW